MEVQWKTIETHPNYQISNHGYIINSVSGKILKQVFNKTDGYYRVILFRDSKGSNFLVHRLIATYFIPNPENKPLVDHINRVRTDNRIENLRWATHSENNQNFPLQKNNKLREQYITRQYNGYMFEKIVNGKRHLKYHKTLDAAIEYRNNFIKTMMTE